MWRNDFEYNFLTFLKNFTNANTFFSIFEIGNETFRQYRYTTFLKEKLQHVLRFSFLVKNMIHKIIHQNSISHTRSGKTRKPLLPVKRIFIVYFSPQGPLCMHCRILQRKPATASFSVRKGIGVGLKKNVEEKKIRYFEEVYMSPETRNACNLHQKTRPHPSYPVAVRNVKRNITRQPAEVG